MKLLILGSEAVPRHEEAQLTDPTEVGPLLHRDEALIRVANSLPTRTILYAYVWFTHDKDNNAVQCVCVCFSRGTNERCSDIRDASAHRCTWYLLCVCTTG